MDWCVHHAVSRRICRHAPRSDPARISHIQKLLVRCSCCGYARTAHDGANRLWVDRPSYLRKTENSDVSAFHVSKFASSRTARAKVAVRFLVFGPASRVPTRYVSCFLPLGGEIIRDLHENPSLRRKSIEQILADRIDDEGGPLLYAMESEEDQQRSFDSTCKKLHRFLSQSPR